MELLITPGEVREIAFAESPGVTEEAITEAAILSAQQKFIRPVVGSLYEELERGLHPQLTIMLKAALAHYVKLLILPQLSVSLGNIGIVQPQAGHFTAAGADSLAALKNATRSQACALIKNAIEHIEANPDDYPGYDASENAMNRISICSKIVL